MSDSLILDYGAKLVATTACICDNLHSIKLKQCHITDQGAIELFQEIREHPTIKYIDLSYNPITSKSFEALANLMTTNKEVIVNMCMNGIQEGSDISLIAPFLEPPESGDGEAEQQHERLFIWNDQSVKVTME